MLIRREQPHDVNAISSVTTAAFRRTRDAAEPPETELVRRLRADTGWLPRLSLVAVADNIVIGHVVCTRGFVDTSPALGLGPISVQPDHQGHGVGDALMHAVLGAAEASDEPLVCLLGDPGYYSRFGFVAASALGIVAPEPGWGGYFQARPLNSWVRGMTGRFQYARPFAGLGLG